MDTPTQTRIATLHPSVRTQVTQIIQQCDLELTGRAKVRITQALRSFKEQDDLFALGRTKANPVGKTAKKPLGNIVTNARAGKSVHNYGFAVDICMIIDGKVADFNHKKDWDNDQVADWFECVKIFIKHGWDWGGNWKSFKDIPHFDKQGFNNWRQLEKLKRDKDNYVVI
jgi:peptidoglycan LD-endopeptidase CwlK